MKKFVLTGIPFVGSVIMAGSLWIFSTKTTYQTPDLSKLSTKLEESLVTLSTINLDNTPAVMNSVSTTDFWKDISESYLWLKSQNSHDRYIYLYSLTEAMSIEDNELRKSALKDWHIREFNRVRGSLSSQTNRAKWDQFSDQVADALHRMLKKENLPDIKPSNHLIHIKSLSENLEAVKNELSGLKPKTEVFETIDNIQLRIFIVLIGLIGTIVSFFAGRTGSVENLESNQTTKIEAFDLLENKTTKSSLDLEDLCRERINELQYLFTSSGLRVHNSSSVTPLFRLNGNKQKLSNAFDALIKGSLALAQNQNDTNSLSLQWSCKTTEERAFFDIEILGKKFDQEELRRNHVLLNGNSIVSQFAKAEKHLENYRPVIQIVPQDNKTRISMSLEIAPAASSVLQVH